MTLMIEMAPELESRLQEKARQRGLTLSDYARGVLEGDARRAASPEAAGDEPEAARLSAIDAIAGKYAGRGWSVEDFCQRKQEEIALEDARHERRHANGGEATT